MTTPETAGTRCWRGECARACYYPDVCSERNTVHERRLAEVLYNATTGTDRPDVPWKSAVQGLWLADAARLLATYQAEYVEQVSRPAGGDSDE